MKLIYATSISYPSSLANRIQILAMAKEFRKALSDNFILGGENIRDLDSNIYGAPINFHSSRSFILAWKYLAYIKKSGITHVYSREPKLLLYIQRYNRLFFHLNLRFYFEAHDLVDSDKALLRQVLSGCHGVVTITQNLKRDIQELCPPHTPIICAPDGIDLELFKDATAQPDLHIPAGKKVVMYTGHLYPWKGVHTLAEAAKVLGDEIVCVFVGGKEVNVKTFKAAHSNTSNVLIVGPKPHQEIPSYLKTADVLVLPNSGKETISRLYTSPMKMFEYMASGKPIIASDLPSLREVLNEGNALFFEADDASSLAEAIRKCLNDRELSHKISTQAAADVKMYTWYKRVQTILDFMK